MQSFKKGNNQGLSVIADVYQDTSLFAATNRRERMHAQIERLREKERRVLQDRRELQRKQ